MKQPHNLFQLHPQMLTDIPPGVIARCGLRSSVFT